MNVKIAIATVAMADNHDDIESAVRLAFPCRWLPTTNPSMNRSGATIAMLVISKGINERSFCDNEGMLFFLYRKVSYSTNLIIMNSKNGRN